jgi:DNA modification methylase
VGEVSMDTNVIYCGDCLVKLKELPPESVDLIYIDPPFSSNRNYVAFWQEQEKRHFEDRFENVGAYIDYMKPRLMELYRVLSPTGSFYYHCDWHASHYVKVLLDRDDLFGYDNFVNEIIWHYRRWTGSARSFLRMHDTLLFYAKDKGRHIFNPPFTDYTEKSLARKQHYHTRIKGDDVYVTSISPKGVKENDVWDIPVINSQATERLGYPTQKPIALLERIIQASSDEGNIVLDAFCGCGTTLAVAQRSKRKWIGIDISPTACRVVANRLEETLGITEGKDFEVRDMPKTVEELRQYPPFEFQNWAINALGGTPNKRRVRDMGIDGKLYPIEDIKKAKGEGTNLFGDIDRYIPIQVKRTDQVGRPDIENFMIAMKRDRRDKGIFIGFAFSRDAETEVRRAERDEGLHIELITVDSITEKQMDTQLK